MTDLEAVPQLAAVPAPSKNAGSQTLDRGIRALEMVAAAPGGMTMQEVADRLEVHRTIAHRLLGTLADHHLIARGPDNRFRAGGGLIAIGQWAAEHAAGHRHADHAGAGRGTGIDGGAAGPGG